MEISGQLHAPTALVEVTEPSTSTGYEAVWTQGPLFTLGKEKNIFSLQEFQPKFLDCRQSTLMDRYCSPC
jgi:hypothetical protein